MTVTTQGDKYIVKKIIKQHVLSASVLSRIFFDDPSRYGPPTRTEYRLIVENLSSRVSWQVSWFPILSPLQQYNLSGSSSPSDMKLARRGGMI